MDAEDAEEIQELLVHEEDCAGGMMNNSFICIAAELSVTEALAQVRLQAPEVDTVYYAYVLDPEERPLGVVSLKELLIQDGELCVSEIMTENLKSVPIDADPKDILEIIAKYNLIAVPVLDEEKKMVGIVAVDDILERFLPMALKHKRHPTY
jgi:Mg/Co/Ni transporter MgtE